MRQIYRGVIYTHPPDLGRAANEPRGFFYAARNIHAAFPAFGAGLYVGVRARRRGAPRAWETWPRGISVAPARHAYFLSAGGGFNKELPLISRPDSRL